MNRVLVTTLDEDQDAIHRVPTTREVHFLEYHVVGTRFIASE
jgi:hypothetical protein